MKKIIKENTEAVVMTGSGTVLLVSVLISLFSGHLALYFGVFGSLLAGLYLGVGIMMFISGKLLRDTRSIYNAELEKVTEFLKKQNGFLKDFLSGEVELEIHENVQNKKAD